MHAIRMERFGGPEVLQGTECISQPSPAGWVRVDVKTAGLNWHDTLVRRGVYDSPLPHVPGADGAGTRHDTGERVLILPSLNWGPRESAPSPRWEILGDRRWGTYAECVMVPQDCLAPVPRGMSWDECAALALTGGTAYRALFTRGRLKREESLLILGAGGGLSTTLVSLARSIADRVVVTSSTSEKIDAAISRGASGGVLYTDTSWPAEARKLSTKAEGFDVIIDAVGQWRLSLEALRPGGRLVVLGSMGDDQVAVSVRRFYFGQFSILGTTLASPRDFASFLGLIDRLPEFKVEIDQTWPLDQAANAHAALEAGNHFGNLVLHVA